jgi:NADPH2:quinone reductase
MSIEMTSAVEAVDIPESMLAWQVVGVGEPEQVMKLKEIAVPRPGPGEVLIDVWSAGINFPDALLTRGVYQERPKLPFTPGLEVCGEIVGVGAGVNRVRLGERVIGMTTLPHGSLAKFAIARSADVYPAPSLLDDASASVFHITYQTGWFGLYRRAGLRVGDSLLVHAAAGGVGSAAVQLGRAAGAKVIAVVGSADKVPVARRLGAHVVIDRSEQESVQDMTAAVMAATEGKGVDVIYDPVGGQAYEVSKKVIAFEGRIVIIGFASGEIPQAATNHLLVKNYAVLGLHWGLYRTKNPDLVARAHDDLCSLVEVGALAPLVSQKLSFEDAPEGIARVAAGTTVGKLAVNPP